MYALYVTMISSCRTARTAAVANGRTVSTEISSFDNYIVMAQLSNSKLQQQDHLLQMYPTYGRTSEALHKCCTVMEDHDPPMQLGKRNILYGAKVKVARKSELDIHPLITRFRHA